MENSILYFFSTIPQVFAAIIALVFVFVFFKLQGFDKSLDVVCTDFAGVLGSNVSQIFSWQRLGSGSTFMTNYKAKYFSNISEVMIKVCSERESDKESNQQAVRNLIKLKDKAVHIESDKSTLIKSTKSFCIFSFSLIISSLSVIPFTKCIESNYLFLDNLFFLFILLSVFAFIWVYRILSVSLKK
ncbi:MAG: hypothetical protein CVT99_06310 [Bacteroidetes bacterium HGW-Bacteroidetes-16]|jgi:hypothetical protein|nr:MAG: hypothetical protein CVT99_06310 [Bacteroidetes bacterium HGW-Bacteroidetes-16]